LLGFLSPRCARRKKFFESILKRFSQSENLFRMLSKKIKFFRRRRKSNSPTCSKIPLPPKAERHAEQ
jgi:hypothetical protein